jgi:hypothetical protein
LKDSISLALKVIGAVIRQKGTISPALAGDIHLCRHDALLGLGFRMCTKSECHRHSPTVHLRFGDLLPCRPNWPKLAHVARHFWLCSGVNCADIFSHAESQPVPFNAKLFIAIPDVIMHFMVSLEWDDFLFGASKYHCFGY